LTCPGIFVLLKDTKFSSYVRAMEKKSSPERLGHDARLAISRFDDGDLNSVAFGAYMHPAGLVSFHQ
jgi:hypothetical protein